MKMNRIAAAFCAIAMVADYGMPNRGALGADLVVAAGMQLDSKMRRLPAPLFHRK